MVSRRLLSKLKPFEIENASVCPGCNRPSPDPFEDHAVSCSSSSGLRTKLWHDRLVRTFQFVCFSSGHHSHSEVSGHAIHGGNMRPNGVLYWAPNVVTDVHTCNPTDHMPRSCSEPGMLPLRLRMKRLPNGVIFVLPREIALFRLPLKLVDVLAWLPLTSSTKSPIHPAAPLANCLF